MTFGAGLAAAAYGVLLLLQRGPSNLVATLTWLVGGVVLHDAVLVPATIAVAWVALRLVPRDRLAPWAVGLVLLGPLTLLAVPVLGRFGARADNPTLLDRNYWAGWSTVVIVVCVAILVARYTERYVERRRRARMRVTASAAVEGGARGPRDGGR
jgi:hypothetical protein